MDACNSESSTSPPLWGPPPSQNAHGPPLLSLRERSVGRPSPPPPILCSRYCHFEFSLVGADIWFSRLRALRCGSMMKPRARPIFDGMTADQEDNVFKKWYAFLPVGSSGCNSSSCRKTRIARASSQFVLWKAISDIDSAAPSAYRQHIASDIDSGAASACQ